jgi:hypothetical protein
MAEFSINPRFIETAQITAGARIAREIAQRLSPTAVKRIQQIMQAADFLDGALGLSGNYEDKNQPLLGGISLTEAKATFAQLNDAQIARKNLFFIEVTDPNPPDLGYVDRPAGAAPGSSGIGDIIDTGRRLVGGGLGAAISGGIGALTGRGSTASSAPRDVSIRHMFNLLATSVSYAPNTMVGEKIPFGSATSDRLNGTEATELSVTTMDDEVGTLKRWFEGKCAQAAHSDGTFGVPGEYLVNIAIYHAVIKPDDRAFKFHAKMRPQTMSHELSRSEQAMQEIQFTFSQFDSFVTP